MPLTENYNPGDAGHTQAHNSAAVEVNNHETRLADLEGRFIAGGGPVLTQTQASATYSTIVEHPPTPQQYRVGGDPDWTLAFGRLFAAGKNHAYVPPSTTTYDITSTLSLPPSMSLTLDPGATVKATATISGAMIRAGDSLTSAWTDKTLKGGKWDCNNLAANGVIAPLFVKCSFEEFIVNNPTGDAIILGDPSANNNSYEHYLRDIKVDGDLTRDKVTNSRGVWLRRAYDGRCERVIPTNVDVGFRNDGNDNIFYACHSYGLGTGTGGQAYNNFPSICFDDNGSDNEYMSCTADMPINYGFRMRQPYRWRIIGGVCLNNSANAGNSPVAIHADSDSTGSIIGMDFTTFDATNAKWAADYDGTYPLASLYVAGCTHSTPASGFTTKKLGDNNLSQLKYNRLFNYGAAPTSQAGTGIGTAPPTITVVSGSTDARGGIKFGTGTSVPAAGQDLLYVTFAVAYPTAPIVVITPRNVSTNPLRLYVFSVGTSSFSIRSEVAPAGSVPANVYEFDYAVIY